MSSTFRNEHVVNNRRYIPPTNKQHYPHWIQVLLSDIGHPKKTTIYENTDDVLDGQTFEMLLADVLNNKSTNNSKIAIVTIDLDQANYSNISLDEATMHELNRYITLQFLNRLKQGTYRHDYLAKVHEASFAIALTKVLSLAHLKSYVTRLSTMLEVPIPYGKNKIETQYSLKYRFLDTIKQ